MSSLSAVSVRAVLDQLSVDPQDALAALEGAPELIGDETSWPIRLLTGFGAWLAGMFFLSIFACFGVLTDPPAQIGMGVLLLLISIAIREMSPARGRTFFTQLALSWVVAGQALVVAGIIQEHDENAAVAAAIVMALGLLLGFRDPVQRWASTVVATLGTAILMGLYEVSHTVDIMVLLTSSAMAAVWLFSGALLTGPAAPLQRPVGFGLATSLGLILITSVMPSSQSMPTPWSMIVLGPLLLGVVLRLLLKHQLSPTSPAGLLAMIGTVTIAGITWSAPGVSASLLMAALAVECRNRLLLGLSVILLVSFGTAFYYWLDVSLLQKSSILIASGLLLLALRMAAQRLTERPQ